MNTEKEVYTYTDDNGKKHHVPIESVNSLSQLQEGDHIAFRRLKGVYFHHAIIEYIYTQEDEIHVIEYSNSAEGFLEDNSSHPKNPGKATVQRGKYKIRDDSMYLIKHGEYLNAEDVVRNAISRLGEREYDLITNNCESFALWCRTCISSSEQGKMVERCLVKVVEAISCMVFLVIIEDSITRAGSHRTKVSVALLITFCFFILYSDR